MTDHSYAATLSEICSEARAKILAENPNVTFNNPNLLLPAHKNKQVRKRQRNQDKENNVTQQDSSSSTQSGEYYQHPLTQLTIPSYQAQTFKSILLRTSKFRIHSTTTSATTKSYHYPTTTTTTTVK